MNDAALLELERQFWFADGEFYRENLSSDCRMALPGMGLVDRSEAIAGIEAGARWEAVDFRAQRVGHLGADTAVVSYEATARNQNGTYEALVGSVYVREAGSWKLAYHQHTPL